MATFPDSATYIVTHFEGVACVNEGGGTIGLDGWESRFCGSEGRMNMAPRRYRNEGEKENKMGEKWDPKQVVYQGVYFVKSFESSSS
jgi:hypothetical protein